MATLDSSGDVRSAAGHAAFSMKGTDDRWVMIQVSTFTNWVNEQLKNLDLSVKDLSTDFCDGIKLCSLMEVLQEQRIGRVIRKPINQHHYLENVSLALKAITKDNIKLVNIGAEDIVNGHLKLIMGLLWHLILRYQIGKSKVPPKKLMLAWIHAIMPSLNINNFSSDWNDGIALHALIEYCKPGTCPNWKQLNRRDGLANCKRAMELAKQHFGIPLVLSPENMSSPDLDELSGMTYLSYFMKVDSPGYNATLNWVRQQIPKSNVRNFQTDWNNGQALISLTQSLGGNVPGWPDHVDVTNHSDVIQRGMNAAKAIGVEPVIPAWEMADPEVDHLGVMAYAAWFQHVKNNNLIKEQSVPQQAPPPVPVVEEPIQNGVVDELDAEPPKARIPPGEVFRLKIPRKSVDVNSPVEFLLEALDEDFQPSNIRAEVLGSNSRPPVKISWHGSTAHAQFTPVEKGGHKILVYNEDELIQGCPGHIDAVLDMSKVKLETSVQKLAHCPVSSTTPIRLNTQNARQGSVKVEARAPSGKIHDMGVSDSSGVYTANFTPTEVGDWLISILYEGQHIQGSPFNVRVYDATQVKVFGLEGGTVGKTFHFSVDASGAGEGQLTVDITHAGRTIPANITQDGPCRFRISFTPDGGGIYNIRVYFAGMEVAGSPYTLEIIDSSAVSASGEGLTSVEVNRRATFMVNTGHAGASGDVKVNVTSPRGGQIPAQVYNNGDGTFRVEYTPNDVGEYLVDVFYYGKPIPGSPYRVHAFDWNRITIRNLRNQGMINRVVEFDIDAAHAGSGNLEIMVNDGTIPCSVQNRGNRQFHASFMPKEPIPHYIQMRFNGRDVPGSPWTVDIKSAAHVTACGPGLQVISAKRLATFEVRTGQHDGNIQCTITSPKGRQVPCRVINQHDGSYRIEYTPMEVGTYVIDVLFESMAIPGSPYHVKAYDTGSISVSPIPNGMVGKPSEFTIDVTRAGEGQLEIMVNRGAVPNSVRMLSKGVFLVTFVPREARTHQVDIKFNGEPLPNTPINVPVLDTSRVTVQGDGLRQVAVNRQSFFRVQTGSAGEAELTARVTSPTNRIIPTRISGSAHSGFDVEFTPNEVGTHRVDIEYGGCPIPNSPFMTKVYDVSKVMVHGVKDGVVGKSSCFIVDVNEAGEGNMEISITGSSGQNIQNHVRQVGPGRFEVSYTPVESGVHRANVTFNRDHVQGSPFQFNVTDASKLAASGDGLGLVPCNKPTLFNINAPGASRHDLEVKIVDPSGRELIPRFFEQGIGHFTVEYTPTVVGDYIIHVTYCGKHISGSPYQARAWDASKVLVSNIIPGRINKPSCFNIDASRAGAGNLEIIVSVCGENVPNFVKTEGNAHFEVSYTPQVADTHMISIKFNGEMVPGSPFVAEISDTLRVHHLGDDLIRVPLAQLATVHIDPRKAGAAAERAIVTVTAPSDHVIKARVTPIPGKHLLKAEFVPREVGPHCIQATIGDIEIQGSPFACDVYDITRVALSRLHKGLVGSPYNFEIDASHAGSGDVSVSVKTNSRKVTCKCIEHGSRVYKASFTPKYAQPHMISVMFGGQNIPGSPFRVLIDDNTNVFARGDCLDAAPLHQPCSFELDAAKALFVANPRVSIIGPPPEREEIPYRMAGNFIEGWTVEWLPLVLGVHTIEIKYGDRSVNGSPFKCKVYDLSKVRIIRDLYTPGINITGNPENDVVFYVDATQAGAGNLEVIVRCAKDGTRIPNFLEATSRNGKFRIYFTPRAHCHNYLVDVMFNEQQVSGSPFHHCIIDGSRATATGQGLSHVSTNCMAYFDVRTNGLSGADVQVAVISPSGRNVACRVTPLSNGDFKAEYLPVEVGTHEITVKYAEANITGSPFLVEAIDASKVTVGPIEPGMLGQPITFPVDTSRAGKGELRLEVRGQVTSPDTTMKSDGHGRYRVTFVPQEGSRHYAIVHFGDDVVKGSPFPIEVLDVGAMSINWAPAKNVALHQTVSIDINTRGLNESNSEIKVTDPYGRVLPSRIARQSHGYVIEYTPRDVGPHTVELRYGGQPVSGSPFTSNAFDPSKVKITDISKMPIVGHEVTFKVDTAEAGIGDLDVDVTCDGRPLAVHRSSVDAFTQKFTFTPISVHDHTIDIKFNSHPVSGMPKHVHISDPRDSLSTSNVMPTVAVGKMANSLIRTKGLRISLHDVQIQIIAPNGEQVPAKIVQQPDGDYKVEYSSKYTGRHTVEILYAGQAIMGSPFYVEIYDPNKIRVEGTRRGMVGQKMEFDIIRQDAGRAELGLSIIGPSGRSVPYDIGMIPGGDHVTYVPSEPGIHQISITYGGLDVPGCPIKQEIIDNTCATAYGEGLERGFEDRQTTFYVDSKGHRGELVVQVEGPNSIAKCNIEPDSNGRYMVTYVPVEVGRYKVLVKWNGREIEGSPFHPLISDPRKIFPIGGWEHLLDANKCLICRTHEAKMIEFDARQAGPGRLTCRVRGPMGQVPAMLTPNDGIYILNFTPATDGEHHIDLMWNDAPIPNSPITVICKGIPVQQVNHNKVILTGHGLREARLREEAEFIIDGTDAGPGMPKVMLMGVKMDVEVCCTQIGENKYRCTYVPQIPGAYLLNIQWSDRQVRGSPFKVNVLPGSDASKVVCMGEGLKTGIMGKEIKATIDTRKAGPGELTANCRGPTMLAYCELIDHHDGRFSLNVKPQEVGKHTLEIKFGGEHVPGSPFILKVAGAPDASKVIVRGPGIEHGILANYQSRFVVETRGAGAGQLTVRIRGPKGAFRVEMQRESQRDRTILCRYDPKEVGDYMLHIKWSGEHVPGSPFHVRIFDTHEEIEHFLMENSQRRNVPMLDANCYGGWQEDL